MGKRVCLEDGRRGGRKDSLRARDAVVNKIPSELSLEPLLSR